MTKNVKLHIFLQIDAKIPNSSNKKNRIALAFMLKSQNGVKKQGQNSFSLDMQFVFYAPRYKNCKKQKRL